MTKTMNRQKTKLHLDADTRPIIAAIDIGSTYSGYAYCRQREGKPLAQHIVMNKLWTNADHSLKSTRAPSCLLLTDKQEFDAFGYEAEEKYLELVKSGRQHTQYYFRRYKTKLFGHKDLHIDTQILDECGRQCPAITVFSATIRYLRNHLMDALFLRGDGADSAHVRWLLTVPAVWTDSAKQFMRAAAEKAGISREALTLALEPECGSVYCQAVPAALLPDKAHISRSGAKYATADLGGGITDIVLHEKRRDGLREISRGVGSKLGGDAVNNTFVQFLKKLLGEDVLVQFAKHHRREFMILMREFEHQKQLMTPKAVSYMEFNLPSSLYTICEEKELGGNLTDIIRKSIYQKHVKLLNNKLRIDAVVGNELFRATAVEIAKVIKHSLTAVNTASDVTTLVLTGAFAESAVLRDVLTGELVGKGNQITKIIVPPEASTAMLKGAVMYGHSSDSVVCRVNRSTLGLRIARLYNPELHSVDRRILIEGVEYILDIFSPFLTVGTRVPVGFISHQSLTTTEPFQKMIEVDIYSSKALSHSFVNDNGCSSLGKIAYPIPSPSADCRTIYVDFILGGTELILYITEKTTMQKTKYHFPVAYMGT